VTSRSEAELVKAVALWGCGVMSDPGLIADETGKPVGLQMTVQSPGGAESPNLGSRLSSIYSVPLIPDQGPVQQLVAAAANPPFHDRIHPRRLNRSTDYPGASGTEDLIGGLIFGCCRPTRKTTPVLANSPVGTAKIQV
jgi:hypothetical protein